MLSGHRFGRSGGNRSGLILGPTASRRALGLNRSGCLDILLRLLFLAFTLSHAPGAVAQGSKAKPLPVAPPDDTDWKECELLCPAHRVSILVGREFRLPNIRRRLVIIHTGSSIPERESARKRYDALWQDRFGRRIECS
jgi:hypothetical protein